MFKNNILTWAILAWLPVLVAVYFLSSCRAEAHNGLGYRANGSITSLVSNLDNFGYRRIGLGYSGALLLGYAQDPFEKGTAPIAFKELVWPSLPSTTETLIRFASERLAEVMTKAEEQRTMSLPLDWDGFYAGLGLMMSCMGLGLIVAGVTNRPSKIRV